jgi:hypothetical protein
VELRPARIEDVPVLELSGLALSAGIETVTKTAFVYE